MTSRYDYEAISAALDQLIGEFDFGFWDSTLRDEYLVELATEGMRTWLSLMHRLSK